MHSLTLTDQQQTSNSLFILLCTAILQSHSQQPTYKPPIL